MYLPDRDILMYGEQLIQPFDKECVEPASVDLHLSNQFLVPDIAGITCVDLDDPVDFMKLVTLGEVPGGIVDRYVLHPGEFILGVTQEKVTLPNNIVGKIEGKSSLGRLGLMVHVTAGFIDPGFRGPVTLEMKNLLQIPIVLRPGKKICQIAFAYLQSPAMKAYNGRYQDSAGVVASRPELLKDRRPVTDNPQA
jgi:dCTP deaminase